MKKKWNYDKSVRNKCIVRATGMYYILQLRKKRRNK